MWKYFELNNTFLENPVEMLGTQGNCGKILEKS